MDAQAFALLDSYVHGFAIQESSLPFSTHEDLEHAASAIVDAMPTERYPHLARRT